MELRRGERFSWGFFSPKAAISFPWMEPGAGAGSDQGDWGREFSFCQIPAGDSSLRSLEWGGGAWITFIQEILKCGEFLYASQPLSIVLLPSPPSLGMLGVPQVEPLCPGWGEGPDLIFIGTISVLVQKTPRSARLDLCSPGLSLQHLSVSAGVIS